MDHGGPTTRDQSGNFYPAFKFQQMCHLVQEVFLDLYSLSSALGAILSSEPAPKVHATFGTGVDLLAHCLYSGQKLRSGLDTDGVLVE